MSNISELFKYVKAEPFFRDFLPEVKSFKHKIRGFNGRGNPANFTPVEEFKIEQAIRKLLAKQDILKKVCK